MSLAAPTQAGTLKGPGRFCGYSPIIDLVPGEEVVTLQGGIHGGSFRWTGAFGSLEVSGTGWASKPRGRKVRGADGDRPALFSQGHDRDRYVVSIWNGRHGAAYFSSSLPLTPAQLRAVDRVRLFEEGDEPQGCNLRTVFSWE